MLTEDETILVNKLKNLKEKNINGFYEVKERVKELNKIQELQNMIKAEIQECNDVRFLENVYKSIKEF